MVDQNEQMYTVICGSFNLVLNPAMDTDNYLHINNTNARNKLIEIMNEHTLVDIFRHQSPTVKR